MRLLEFLAAYFRTGGGRVVERNAGGRVTPIDHGDEIPVVVSRGGPLAPEVVPLDTLLDDAPPRRVCVHPELGGPCRDGCAPADVDAEAAAVLARDELDEHYADARAVVDAGRGAVDQYDADRAGAATDVRPLVLAPEIAPAPPAETGVNVDLLRRVLVHITAHPEQWDQHLWWKSAPGCGTAGCVAGWAVEMTTRPGWRTVQDDRYRTCVVAPNGEIVGRLSDVARARLRLSDRQAVALFDDGNTLEDLWGLAARFTDGAIVPPAELPDGS